MTSERGQQAASEGGIGQSASTARLEGNMPFCSEELNDLMNQLVSVLCEFGMTEIDDVIDTAIARRGVRKGRRDEARRLIETAFNVLAEIKGLPPSNK